MFGLKSGPGILPQCLGTGAFEIPAAGWREFKHLQAE
jgi:hypothetical protein